MHKDLRPYWVKKIYLKFRAWYSEHYLRPRFSRLGDYGTFMRPWYIAVNGENISLGRCATVVAEPDQRVAIGVWGEAQGEGEIVIGDYVMISPGVRISASRSIRIGDSCMLANGVYITDSDWHGVYDRVARDSASNPVVIGDNVWLGDRATLLKGVSVGDNSIVAASAVVTKDVPANVIVAGNPAVVVRQLDAARAFTTRAEFFSDPAQLQREYDAIDRMVLQGNSLWRWLLSVLWPRGGRS